MSVDFVFSAGSIVFIIALIPTLLSNDKPPVFSSVVTGGVLLVYSLYCYTSLELWYSFGTTLALALMWLGIGVQKAVIDRRTPRNRECGFVNA